MNLFCYFHESKIKLYILCYKLFIHTHWYFTKTFPIFTNIKMQRLYVSLMLRSGVSVRPSFRKFSCQFLISGYRNGSLPLMTSLHKCKQDQRTLLSANLVDRVSALQKRGVGSSELCSTPNSRGLVLGVYANEDDKLDIGILTDNAAKYNEVRNNKFIRSANKHLNISREPQTADSLSSYVLLVQCRSAVNAGCFTRWNPTSP